jgi:hypothetical protein
MVCYIFLVFTISKPGIAFLLFPAYGNSRASVSEKELKEKHANITGEVTDVNHLVAGINTESDSGTSEDGSARAQRGMILSFDPLSLTFNDVRYSVDMPPVKIEPCFC